MSLRRAATLVTEKLPLTALQYMNHLDVGYDGIYPELGFIVNVINKYCTS